VSFTSVDCGAAVHRAPGGASGDASRSARGATTRRARAGLGRAAVRDEEDGNDARAEVENAGAAASARAVMTRDERARASADWKAVEGEIFVAGRELQ
tara:strand:- start:250 stop:543 length:294 start_codon:yes stop_codon:yes gene_type:complete